MKRNLNSRTAIHTCTIKMSAILMDGQIKSAGDKGKGLTNALNASSIAQLNSDDGSDRDDDGAIIDPISNDASTVSATPSKMLSKIEPLRRTKRASSTTPSPPAPSFATTGVTEAGRSAPDKERKYGRVTERHTIVTTMLPVFPNLGINKTKEPDTPTSSALTGKVRRAGGLNQWTIMGVVMKSIDDNILNRISWVINGRPERKIVQRFGRFAFPKAI
ncbi:hypothetical protein F5Y14DRAFT_456985 [Nemania sp. NC0429]|nr:hypothetical protein F5Y14DRAFT_456985 [Nemania sp. NC0429]